jgi:hypothetical protein
MFDLYSQEEVKGNVAIESKEFKKELDNAVKIATEKTLISTTIEDDKIEPDSTDKDADEPKKANVEVDYSSMKVKELKVHLKEYGLTTTGKRADLIERLTNK